MGRLDGVPCFAADLGETAPPPAGRASSGVRELFGKLPDDLFALAGRALHLVHWHQTNRFCGRCGARTGDHTTERAKNCPQCGLLVFPRLSPAVIVAVRKRDAILLARNRQRSGRMFSIIAGFVEPGESLEDAVRRELREEVGIEVQDLRYFGSQPWPYPDSLMLGFTAEYASGEIDLRDSEIAEAGWYRADAFPPEIPSPISISRALIDNFVATTAATAATAAPAAG
jgi:NAD+ diphosphatase